MKLELGPPLVLPPGFAYPQRYLDWRYHGLPEIAPWHLYPEGALSEMAGWLQQTYPHLLLVPFARRIDADDIACFLGTDGRITTVDHAPELGDFGTCDDFDAWLDEAVRVSREWLADQ